MPQVLRERRPAGQSRGGSAGQRDAEPGFGVRQIGVQVHALMSVVVKAGKSSSQACVLICKMEILPHAAKTG